MLVNLNTNNTNITEDVRNAMSAASASITTTASIVLPANTARVRYALYNAGPATIFIREGAVPVATGTPVYSFPLPSGFYWQDKMDDARYTGAIHAVTASGTASLMVSEATLTT